MSARSGLLLLIACGESDTGSVVEHTDTEDTTDTGDTGNTDTGDTGNTTPDTSDEAILRAAIAGEHDAEAALTLIAASGGFPVETASGDYLFACLCGSEDWMLAGDHEGWVGQPMSRTGALSHVEVTIPSPDGSLYKFTDSTNWIADPLARRYGTDSHGTHSIVRATAAHLERWYGLSASGLLERDVRVWVPDGGHFTHSLYMHDGQNLFDPGAIWGGWRLQESLPDGLLVIGIDNTADRFAEYTHTTDLLHGTSYGGQGADYAALVEEHIRPLMESAYGVPDTVGVMGSSLGGLISLYIATQYPDRYDMALSLSGTVGWGSIGTTNPTIIEQMAASGHQGPAIYIDSGGSGLCRDSDSDGIDDDGTDFDNYCVNLQLRDVLAGIGYTSGVDLWHWHEEDAPHNEYAWAERVFRPLELFVSL